MAQERVRNQGEFKVEVTGTGAAYEWIRIQEEVASEGLGGQGELPLATHRVSDGFLEGIGVIAEYDRADLSYKIQCNFVIPGSNNAVQDTIHASLSDISNPEWLRERIGEVVGRFGSQSDDLLSSIKPYLAAGLSQKGLELSQGDESCEYKILAGGDEQREFEVHSHPHLIGTAFELIVRGSGKESREEFETKFMDFADLIPVVLKALYDTEGREVPRLLLKIAPPNNTEATIRNIRAQLRRTVLAEGLMDDERLVAGLLERIALESRPDVSFDDIGGQEKAKEELRTVSYALLNPEAFREEGTRPTRGILLYGPPGTGKTMLAKALAREAQAQIYLVRLADIIHHLYGKSEKLISEVFNLARKNAPVVLLFDEIDALASQRQYSSEATSRIVSVLLTEMQGFEERDDNIVVVGSTNRLDAIDPALLRPGRFDLLIEVDNPSDEERKVIFEIKMDKARDMAQRELFDDLDMQTLVAKTKGMSGADIEEVIRRVLVKNVKAKMQGRGSTLVTTERILAEIADYESIRKAKGSIGFIKNNGR